MAAGCVGRPHRCSARASRACRLARALRRALAVALASRRVARRRRRHFGWPADAEASSTFWTQKWFPHPIIWDLKFRCLLWTRPPVTATNAWHTAHDGSLLAQGRRPRPRAAGDRGGVCSARSSPSCARRRCPPSSAAAAARHARQEEEGQKEALEWTAAASSAASASSSIAAASSSIAAASAATTAAASTCSTRCRCGDAADAGDRASGYVSWRSSSGADASRPHAGDHPGWLRPRRRL